MSSASFTTSDMGFDAFKAGNVLLKMLLFVKGNLLKVGHGGNLGFYLSEKYSVAKVKKNAAHCS